jgi:hypothetical protein
LSQLFNYSANTTYTLSFDVSRNPNGSDGYSGAVLDNVTLTAAVPEPETCAMLLGGLGLMGLMGFMARRRKAAK